MEFTIHRDTYFKQVQEAAAQVAGNYLAPKLAERLALELTSKLFLETFVQERSE